MSKIYVTPHINDWAVKQEGLKALISVHNTEEEAITAAKKIALGRNAEIIILKRDGAVNNLGLFSANLFSRGTESIRI
ncbi:MAG: DUF2188 domain-containing protein [Ignavibacteriaceae bacterium]